MGHAAKASAAAAQARRAHDDRSGQSVAGKLHLQIPASRQRHHFAKATIRVLEYSDGAIALFHGPRQIAKFRSNGTLDEGPSAKKELVA